MAQPEPCFMETAQRSSWRSQDNLSSPDHRTCREETWSICS